MLCARAPEIRRGQYSYLFLGRAIKTADMQIHYIIILIALLFDKLIEKTEFYIARGFCRRVHIRALINTK